MKASEGQTIFIVFFVGICHASAIHLTSQGRHINRRSISREEFLAHHNRFTESLNNLAETLQETREELEKATDRSDVHPRAHPGLALHKVPNAMLEDIPDVDDAQDVDVRTIDEISPMVEEVCHPKDLNCNMPEEAIDSKMLSNLKDGSSKITDADALSDVNTDMPVEVLELTESKMMAPTEASKVEDTEKMSDIATEVPEVTESNIMLDNTADKLKVTFGGLDDMTKEVHDENATRVEDVKEEADEQSESTVASKPGLSVDEFRVKLGQPLRAKKPDESEPEFLNVNDTMEFDNLTLIMNPHENDTTEHLETMLEDKMIHHNENHTDAITNEAFVDIANRTEELDMKSLDQTGELKEEENIFTHVSDDLVNSEDRSDGGKNVIVVEEIEDMSESFEIATEKPAKEASSGSFLSKFFRSIFNN